MGYRCTGRGAAALKVEFELEDAGSGAKPNGDANGGPRGTWAKTGRMPAVWMARMR